MDSVQKDRATGTLHLRSSGGDATLYFLFGHLFHAVDATDQGESVVHRVLDWGGEGEFTFDVKAKLPAEETIKVSTAELLANRPAPNGSAETETTAEAATEPGANGASAPDAASTGDMTASQPQAAVPSTPAASASAGESPKRRRTDQRPEMRPPETMALYPVPGGKSLHEGLTAGFVDFPKLLRSLARDGHSGYVRLNGDDFTGVLLFSSGEVVEAIYDAGGLVSTGTAAFSAFGDRIDDGDGGLDVIQLSPEMVTGIYQLLTSPSTYLRLAARFIKADALLEYLGEQGTSGAVIVRNAESVGVVLFREGQILGSYTDTARNVSDSTALVLALCDDPAAEIEVRGGEVPSSLPVMEGGRAAPRQARAGATSTAVTPAAAVHAAVPATHAAVPANSPPEVASGAPDAAASSPSDVDWASAINQMAGRADTVLGTRSKKVKELLFAANHTREDIDGTIARISELSIMFVDPSKLSSLAEEFKQIAARAA